MSNTKPLLTTEQKQKVETIAVLADIQGQRAQALLAVNEGETQAAAAAKTGLSAGQVGYIVRKFRRQGLEAFPAALLMDVKAETKPALPAPPELAQLPEPDHTDERVQALIGELDDLLAQLKETVPAAGSSPYSPIHFLSLLRENITQFTPDVQMGMLENFREMTVEDLTDIETWKGMAYMLSYSARFQADQMRERMNEQLPHPIKPDTVYATMMQNVERLTPNFMKEMVQEMQISREDVLDPDTWKGLWHLMAYSFQFQANQLKERVVGRPETAVDDPTSASE